MGDYATSEFAGAVEYWPGARPFIRPAYEQVTDCERCGERADIDPDSGLCSDCEQNNSDRVIL